MKKIFLMFTAIAMLFAVGCSSEYDDTAVWNELKKHDERISKLETLCGQMNTNISSLQAIVTALQSNDYVTGIAPITQNGVEVGYTITFSKSGSITIYHGKDGATPVIGVKQDTDGVYYWTLNGEWLLDDAGNKIKAVGADGKDGENGTNGADGKDGITPQLKIEDDYWYISYDYGTSWTQIGKATSVEGSSCVITNVANTETAVIFTLADGSTITISKLENAVPNKEIIQFVDQIAKLLCVSYFDTDGDGELSYAEAAAVTDITGIFSHSPIICFDELQYFVSLTKIGDQAFKMSQSLRRITLPQNITAIGNFAFVSCAKLSEIAIPDSVTSIGVGAFQYCDNLTEIVIPDGVTTIGNGAFMSCDNLTNITIGKNVTTIDTQAFYQCYNLTEIVIPDSVITIGSHAFYNCDDITNITIGKNVTTIGEAAFSQCNNFTEIVIPDSVTTIGDYAFNSCDSLTNMTIGKNVTSIGYEAFCDCISLKNTYCKAITPPVLVVYDNWISTFEGCNAALKIYVPTESVDAYKAADGWKEYADAIEPYNFE